MLQKATTEYGGLCLWCKNSMAGDAYRYFSPPGVNPTSYICLTCGDIYNAGCIAERKLIGKIASGSEHLFVLRKTTTDYGGKCSICSVPMASDQTCYYPLGGDSTICVQCGDGIRQVWAEEAQQVKIDRTANRKELVLRYAGIALVQLSRRIANTSEAEMAVRCFNYAEAMADEAERRGYANSR